MAVLQDTVICKDLLQLGLMNVDVLQVPTPPTLPKKGSVLSIRPPLIRPGARERTEIEAGSGRHSLPGCHRRSGGARGGRRTVGVRRQASFRSHTMKVSYGAERDRKNRS